MPICILGLFTFSLPCLYLLINCCCVLQICNEFERFSKYLSELKVAVFYGGVHIKKHKDLLKNDCPHIVVGTPGRILALAREKDLSLKNVRHFILDECDKMLESLGNLLSLLACFLCSAIFILFHLSFCFIIMVTPLTHIYALCRHEEGCPGDLQDDTS